MTESEFNQRANDLFERIGAAVDAGDSDCDWDMNEGILTLHTEGGQIIINRHAPNQEIWLAGKTGAAHFRWDGAAWQDTRSAQDFSSALMLMFKAHTDVSLDF
ncbi:MAG: hypothetical protein RLZZ502_49 [Pseudomonadota bacterium]